VPVDAAERTHPAWSPRLRRSGAAQWRDLTGSLGVAAMAAQAPQDDGVRVRQGGGGRGSPRKAVNGGGDAVT
jgi:hypothetical protein